VADPAADACPACGELLAGPAALVGRDRLHHVAGEFGVRICGSCGTGSTQPAAGEAELASHYPSGYSAHRDRDGRMARLLAPLRRARDRRLVRAAPFGDLSASGPGALLDVGCGKGQIGGPFAAAGWRVIGIDPSAEAVARAAERGIDARQGTLATVVLGPEERFDAAVFNHSLEHVADPVADLRRAADVLRPGGRILISVPNFGGWQRRLFGASWFHLDVPRHRTHFTAAGLAAALERAGLAVSGIRTATSAMGFFGSLEIAARGRSVLRGGPAARLALPVTVALSRVVAVLDRPLGGGDVLHAEARLPGEADDAEADRIRRVYAGYDTDPRVQARRDRGNRANVAIERERAAALDAALSGVASVRLPEAEILDVGCGTGDELVRLRARGADPGRCHGVDLLPDRIARARERLPAADLREADARDLPFGAATMDVVVLKVVLSSVLDPAVLARIATEVDRVLRAGGAVLWYDNRYPNPFNPHVTGIRRRELARLFPGYELRVRTVTVVPPLVRRLGPATERMYGALSLLPFLRVRYAGVLIKGGLRST
jgi:SAM-dependent methyltransferase